jgi:hypothetical protein
LIGRVSRQLGRAPGWEALARCSLVRRGCSHASAVAVLYRLSWLSTTCWTDTKHVTTRDEASSLDALLLPQEPHATFHDGQLLQLTVNYEDASYLLILELSMGMTVPSNKALKLTRSAMALASADLAAQRSTDPTHPRGG